MRIAKYLRDSAVFVPCYIALDWASYIHPLGPFNITPWNPQPALAIVWMLLGGVHHAAAVLLTIFVAEVVVRNAPGGYGIALLTAATLTCGYAAISWLLRSSMRPTAGLRSTRQLTQFTLVVVAGTAVVGAAFVGALRLADMLGGTPAPIAWLRFWVGDVVGVLVTAPLLLAVVDPGNRSRLLRIARRPETLLQAAVLASTVWLVFEGLGGDPARHFYLLFVPMIWAALRGGMNGAVLAIAIVQIGVVIGIGPETGTELPVVDLQSFVAALTLAGLYLGMMVDERERAAESLRQTLRLAAAGEMAGAVAHEVGQPLTALVNYGRSAQLLAAERGAAANQLPEVIGKMVTEAERAGEVVRRLRDFFRAGTTRLELVTVDDLLASAHATARQLAGSRGIHLDVAAESRLPALYVDRLQIELVLRNLVTNAMEALEGVKGTGTVRLLAVRHDAQHVRIAVADNGPGIPQSVRDRLFEPLASGKATGMGLGLSVSRAIAEAHGGSLDAVASDHGEFHLVLPCAQKT